MVRRAFGPTFADAEIEDLYGAAWLGTLRALDRRRAELDDEALRRYVLTAVANQASKELRRRGRRPTVDLEQAGEVADRSPTPDERAAATEQARLTRDALRALPPRRRAVIMLRYGWGLDPRHVCGLIEGLSPRAYRREITKGVEELSARLGDAVTDETGVERRLHPLGAAVSWPALADVVGTHSPRPFERALQLFERARESVAGLLGRGEPADAASGVGAAGIAKLAGAGAPKLAAACLGTGAAATACVAAGLGSAPIVDVPARIDAERARPHAGRAPHPVAAATPAPPDPAAEDPAPGGADPRPSEEPTPFAPAAAPAVEPTPPADREFGLAASGVANGGGGGAGAGGNGGSGAREFGP